MVSTPSIDSGVARSRGQPEPDAHGQAALLLAESTLHSLVERGALTKQEAITTVQIAAEVKLEVATLAGESHGRMQASLDLLSRIEASFGTDTAGEPATHDEAR